MSDNQDVSIQWDDDNHKRAVAQLEVLLGKCKSGELVPTSITVDFGEKMYTSVTWNEETGLDVKSEPWRIKRVVINY